MGRCSRIAVYVSWLFAFSIRCAAQEEESAFVGTRQGWVQPDASYGIVGEFADDMLAPREFNIRVAEDGSATLRARGRGRSWDPLSWPFALIASGDTAVLLGQHRSAYWVESVSFNITKLDEDTPLVYWWRVVNNTQVHPDDEAARFAVGGYGELSRRGRRGR